MDVGEGAIESPLYRGAGHPPSTDEATPDLGPFPPNRKGIEELLDSGIDRAVMECENIALTGGLIHGFEGHKN